MTGEELKKAQEKMGMSNVELASLSGYQSTVISRMRNDKQPISPQLSCIVRQALELHRLRSRVAA